MFSNGLIPINLPKKRKARSIWGKNQGNERENLGNKSWYLNKVEEIVWNEWETSTSKFFMCRVCIRSDGYFSKVSSRACLFNIWTRRGIEVVSK